MKSPLAWAVGLGILFLSTLPTLGQTARETGPNGRPWTPPALDLQRLRQHWTRSFIVERGCAWKTYHLEAPPEPEHRTGDTSAETTTTRLRGAIGNALEDSSQEGVCGPTIFLKPGRYVEGLLDISKPTVLVGEPGVVIVGTIRDTTGAPLWLQHLAIHDAPFPGALFVSHPNADSTVINVDISAANGYGVVHDGGRLEAWNLLVEGTRAAPGTATVGGAGPSVPGRSGYPGRYRLGTWLAGRAARNEVMGGGVIQWIKRIMSIESSGAPDLALCSGTGLLVSGGAYVELYDTSFSINESAGLAARGLGTWVNLFSFGAAINGFAPAYGDFTNGQAAIDSPACFGGIDIADQALLLGQVGTVIANSPVGLLLRRGAVAGLAAVSVAETAQSAQDTFGDNVLVTASFVSLSGQFSLTGADRAGLILVDSASGNAVDGVVTGNKFGIVLQQQAQLYLNGVDFSGNGEEDFVQDGDLPTPDAPLDVPSI